MKNLKLITFVIYIILICSRFTPVKAANYYFSWSSGDDARTAAQAQNPASPWRSLLKLNAIFSSLRPGDAVYFKRGDVFEGAINITASGSNGNPIVLAAYGTGNNPMISGLTFLSGWSLSGNNIWETTTSFTQSGVNVVLLNGTLQPIGRYPNSNEANSGYLTIESYSGSSSITDNQLPSFPNWNGGDVVIRKNHWVLDRNKITGHNGNTINYSSESGYYASNNYGYFIQNHPKTLNQNGEWYYDGSSKKLGVYSTTGSPSFVEASNVNTLVTVTNQNNITFQDITFKGSNQNAFELSNTQGVQILTCDILFSGADAVLALGCNNLHVEGCTIYHTNNCALELRNSWGAIIKNNQIKCTGIFAGMGKGDSGSYEAILMDGDNEVVELNTIDSTGYIPITFRGNVNFIKNNFISNYNLVKDDGGGIYTWNNIAGAPPTYGSKIIGNILLNGIGAKEGTDDLSYGASNGIYMDDNTAGVEITGNTVANCGLYGLYVHNGHELTISNNTFYNSSSQLVLAHDNYAAYAPIRNVSMTNNIFFSKDNSQLVAEFKTPDNDIANFGTFNNNFYCRPAYESYVINTSYQSDGTNLDLTEWKALYGKDAASTKFPVSASSYDHIRFEYNASATSKNISLDGSYVDARSNVYNGNINLAPFSSAVLVKQAGATSLCPGTGSITREQWNTINGDLTVVPWQTTPTKTTVLTGALETSTIGDAFGSRIRGFICPPQTGPYTFWIAGDDITELWLSTDDNPANKKKIANLSSWTTFRNWNKSPSQKSGQINLQAGQHYYIEVLQKEGNGGDHVSVAWQLPDGSFEGPIAGTRLSPSAVSSTMQNQAIDFPALPNSLLSAGPATLTATASSALPVSFFIVSGPATIVGNIVTPTAAGTIIIKASQSGNAQYNPAPDVVQNLIVESAGAGGQCAATGSILREQWNGISGNDVSQIPIATPPSSTSQLTLFEGPRDIANNYGSRIRGYICPPQSGNYIFWIAGDDGTELWLSTNESPSNKIKIAYSLNWTSFREWNKYASQKSASVYLQAGQKYYIEALQKESGGGDHLSVAWQLPDGVMEAPIAGSRLLPYSGATISLLDQSINFAPLPNFMLGQAPLTLVATASSALPVSFSVVSGPATISGNLLTPTGTGIVVIKATQAGNAQYNPAAEITQQLLIVITVQCAATGSLLREQWNNIPGNDVVQIPQSSPPSSSGQITSFEGPQDVANNYGSRIRGYICPPLTGNYTFYIAGDDGTELWLSTNESPSNKIKIAYSLSWTNFRDWNRYASQKSMPVYLQAGQKYYVEALQKEGGGGDHVSIAWQMPDGVFEGPISGSRLSPFAVTTALLNQTINFPSLQNITLGSSPVTLSAAASSGLSVSFSIVSGPATIAGNMVTPTGLGTVVIKASQTGNALYNAAPDVLQNLVVLPSLQTCSATGSILREQWDGIDGNDVWQIPQSSAPSSTSQLTLFEGPDNFADHYGSRIRGYICPPQSGNYVFYISGDDATELWLSTNENPSNKIKIAYSLSWTNFRDWNRYASQKSASVYLEAGQKYYIEALQKEGNGGDHLSVAWQLPDGVMEAPIAGSRLSPFQLNDNNNQNGKTAMASQTINNLNGTATQQVAKERSVVKAFPNPFKTGTVVAITPAETGLAAVDVYDISGRKLHSLFSGNMQAGISKQFRFEGSNLSSGIYFVRYTSIKGAMNYKVILNK